MDERTGAAQGVMLRLPKLTPRMMLILAHDLLAAVAAVVAAFYIRFELAGLTARWHLLLLLLPGFVLYSAGVFSIFGLYKNKWRFTSLPDLMNIIKVSTVLAMTLLVLDYVLLAPNIYGTFFFGKITIVLYWFLQVFFLAGSRIAYRYFRYTRTLQHARRGELAPTIVMGPAADAEVLLRGIESGAFQKLQVVGILSPSRADRGQSIRGVPVVGDFDDLERVVQDFADRGTAVTRLVMTPIGAGAGDEAGSDPHPGAPARAYPDPHPRSRTAERRSGSPPSTSRTCCCARARRSTTSASRPSCTASRRSSPAAADRSAPKSATGSRPSASPA